MFKETKQLKLAFLALMILGLTIVGCSENNPMRSNAVSENATVGSTTNFSPGAEVELYGHVATLHVGNREMTIADNPTLITIEETAEVVFKDSGNETPIEVHEISIGDSVEVRGEIQMDGSLLADRVRVRAVENENETEIKGRVETIDATARTITLFGHSTLINVLPNASVVHKVSGTELPIELSEILPGDSVEVRGNMETDGTLSADRVRLRDNDDFNVDLEIKDTITAIDYVNGTMMIRGRNETILVDSNTFIYTHVDDDTASSRQVGKGNHSDDDGDGEDEEDSRLRATLSLANLVVGDYIELHADVIDASTLYAVVIELEDGAFDLEDEIEFKDLLATVNTGTGEVTFQTDTRIGEVVDQTVLLGLMGETLTLDQFSAGEIVEVHGFDLGDGRFRVLEMQKDNNL